MPSGVINDHGPVMRSMTDSTLALAPEAEKYTITSFEVNRAAPEPLDFTKSHNTAGSNLNTVPPGWETCVHPKGWIYFYNPSLRVTTDDDIRVPEILARVEHSYTFLPLSIFDDEEAKDGMQMEVHLNSFRGETDVGFSLGLNHRLCVAGYVLEEVTSRCVEKMTPNQLNRKRRLYWNHLWNHPSHRPTPKRALEDATEALTWFYTDNLLGGPRSVVPFSKEECADLSQVVQNLSQSHNFSPNSPGKTVFLAWLLREVCSFRDAELYGQHTLKVFQQHQDRRRASHTLENLDDTKQRKPQGFLMVGLGVIINIFFFSIPWTYHAHVSQASEYHGRLENVKRNWNAYIDRLVKEYSHFLLISTVLLSAAVSVLAIEELSQPVLIAATISAFAALGSIIVGVFSMWRHQTNIIADRNASSTQFTYMNNIRHNPLGFYGHAMLLSLPAVLLVYALIAFLAALAAYTAQGLHAMDGPVDDDEQSADVRPWWIVVGILLAMAGAVTAALYTFSVIWSFKRRVWGIAIPEFNSWKWRSRAQRESRQPA